MGLDVRWYTNVRLTPYVIDYRHSYVEGSHGDGEKSELVHVADDNLIDFVVNESFPLRAGSIQAGRVYRFDQSGHFYAGSYFQYNQWRDQLRELGLTRLPDPPSDKPFEELVVFSDSSGVLGTEACRKLAKDFVYYRSLAEQHPDNLFLQFFEAWRKAFQVTGDNNGVVRLC